MHHLEDLQKEVNMKKGHVQDQAYMKTQDIVIKQVHHLEDQYSNIIYGENTNSN